MAKRKCKFIITETKDGFNTKFINDGFNALEILGMLDLKRRDIIEQMYHPEDFMFVRETKTEDGKIQKVHMSNEEVIDEVNKRDPVHKAYAALLPILGKKKVTKNEILEALEEAVGHLGEALDE